MKYITILITLVNIIGLLIVIDYKMLLNQKYLFLRLLNLIFSNTNTQENQSCRQPVRSFAKTSDIGGGKCPIAFL